MFHTVLSYHRCLAWVGPLPLCAILLSCHVISQEGERHYLLTKARYLRDATHDDDLSQALAHQPASNSSFSHGNMASLLTDRVKGETLPTVEVAGEGLSGLEGRDGERSVRGVYEGLLVMAVLEHVVCGGLRGELFVELMEEVVGRTGYRKG